ncbi:putative LRR receptor-like serine/threonine-protein kinase RKF3 [Curcuma longa]|uniref:putative LRR receptor-like serine/threonine-protein kinase RKF3 n=1 Tax=Curcuma longa TaxID=136217 RepID=UPI003D9DFFE6
MNLTSRGEFEDRVPRSAIAEIGSYCNQSLQSSQVCAACTASLNRFKAEYLPGPDYGNVSDCNSYPFIYSAAAISGSPSSVDNAYCYFLLSANSTSSPPRSGGGRGGRSSIWIYAVCSILFLLLLVFASLIWIRRRRSLRRTPPAPAETRPSRALESISASTTLIKFTYEDIQLATRNFSRDNIIGRGGYGNVYKGVLADGTEVALKRFKNCSASGDASFAHEVEVIASVRHVNLLALRGYCIATTQMEGHQRIIVCDLMQNGSLHDHLFATEGHRHRLSWPLRQKVAVGTARGLAYLHTGAQPSIIHRDIKASNILLDENFEPKVADFGLAKFTPEGTSHVSTKVAGTLGYVAPEYALYGQLSEKSDVFSFGVLLLELLSGKKAFGSRSDGQAFVVNDWAWSLARRGRALDVIEEGMDELGPKEVLEKYVHVAVLCTHPQYQARPSMDQILKILETDLAVPATDRPFPILSDTENTESSSESALLSSSAGYQSFTFGKDEASNDSGIVSKWSPGVSKMDKSL